MTDSEMRIAIAEVRGKGNRWVIMKRGLYYRKDALGYTNDPEEAWILTEEEANWHVYPHDEPVTKHRAPPRNYLDDLNAMHEAEEKLGGGFYDGSQWLTYVRLLHRKTGGYGERATARQRAEAFLQTIGKWKEAE